MKKEDKVSKTSDTQIGKGKKGHKMKRKITDELARALWELSHIIRRDLKRAENKDKPPITCVDCGRELTDDEVAYFFDNIEDDDDKPYCNGCISKMDTTERAVDDVLMEGE